MTVVPLTLTPTDPLAKVLLRVPMTLRSAGLEVWVPKAGVLPPGDTIVTLLNWKLRVFPLGHFETLMPLNWQAESGVVVLARVADLDSQGEIGLYSTAELRKSLMLEYRRLFRVSVLPCPVENYNPIQAGPVLSGMQVWITSPGKEPWLEGACWGNMERIVE